MSQSWIEHNTVRVRLAATPAQSECSGFKRTLSCPFKITLGTLRATLTCSSYQASPIR